MLLLIYFTIFATLTQGVTQRKTKLEINSNYLQEHRMIITANHTALDVILNIAQDLPSDPWTSTTIALREPKSDKYRNLLSYDINVCDILGKAKRDKFNLAHMWIENVWKYGNLPRSCPILKGNYTWHGFKLQKFSLPSVMLSGKYRAYINTYMRSAKSTQLRNSVANATIYVQLK